MSHQEAKTIAAQVVRDLLAKYPPGLVVMVIRALTRMQRAIPDITVFAEPQKPGATGLPTHPPRHPSKPITPGSGIAGPIEWTGY